MEWEIATQEEKMLARKMKMTIAAVCFGVSIIVSGATEANGWKLQS